MEKIIVNSKGLEREVLQFPDKKSRLIDPNRIDKILYEASQVYKEFDIGQQEATFKPTLEYPKLPYFILLMTDTHYGSTKCDLNLVNKHLEIVGNTPNFGLVHNGDSVDNFNATGKWASGMMENPLPPQLISRVWAEKLKQLDEVGKIGALGFGNHNDFGENAGQDWYDTFLSKFRCPVFTTGGLLNISVGSQEYKLAMTHKYWGNSKLNPNNASRRFMEYEHPDADIVFLGHTHVSAGEQFERAEKKKVAVIGGTYKLEDGYARKRGIGGRGGSPGWVIAMWPDKKQLQLFRDVEIAKDYIEALSR